MFIIKFNKLIHNKWLWGAFAVVVAVAFAGTDILTGRRSASPQAGAGSLDGETVSFERFELVRQLVLMERGRDHEMSADDMELEVWRRLAVLRKAERMGLMVTDDEIEQVVRGTPAFGGPGGEFDQRTYERVLAGEWGLTPFAYEQILRLQLLQFKVESAVAAVAFGVPSLAAEKAAGLTDRYTVRVVDVPNRFAEAEIEITDEELEAFFDDRRPLYRVPEKVAVRYVSFRATAFREGVEIDADDLRDHYDANKARFRTTTDGESRQLEFDEARSMIEGELTMQAGREKALDAAADFADLFYLGVEGARAPGGFEHMATARGYTVVTTELFTAESRLPRIDRDAPFVRQAFDLNPDSPRDRFSDVISGRDAFYVLAFHERTGARDPDLQEVRERVLADALEAARKRSFAEEAGRLRATLGTEIEQGRAFDEVAAELSLQVGTNMTLTAVDAYGKLPGGENLATRMVRMAPGELSPLVQTDDGAVILRVEAREPGEELQLGVMSRQMALQLRGGLSDTVIEAWRQQVLDGMVWGTPRRSAAIESQPGDGR